jgi:hypothetical protein
VCIIVDANVVSRVLLTSQDPDFAPVNGRLFALRGLNTKLVYGGKKLREEYHRIGSVRRVISELDRMGRVRLVSDKEVDAEEQSLIEGGDCKSDDEHILAVARVSHVRVLVSHDQELHRDFKNHRILRSPRGRVYQNTKHSHVLGSCDTT